jgi:membrane protein implicated in regulation of membrane protease activity
MRPRLDRLPLALAITATLVLKVIILSLIWKAFFSTPQTKKMRLPTGQVEQRLLGTHAPATPTLKAAHDSPR